MQLLILLRRVSFDAIGAIVPLALVAAGILMLASPVSFTRLCGFIGRRGLGNTLSWSDPSEVERSLWMRFNFRVAGVVIILLALGVIWTEFFGF
jgi:hypothetical protein